MSTTLVRKSQIRPLNIIRSDINTTTSGSALITKVIAGTGLTLSSTGVNSGTGDVTITLTPATASVLGGVKIGSGLTVGIDGTISVTPVTVTWGTITGTLSNQTDLQNALDAKYNNPTGTTADYIDGTGAIQAFPLTLPTEFISHEVKSSNHINKGQAVYVSDANGTNMIVDLASNNAEATSSKTMGLIDRTVNPNDLARVVTEGLLDGLDTSAAQPGDPVWLGVNGDLLFGLGNKPVAPRHLVFIGIVTRVQQNNGEIFVKVQNGYEFNEIHNYLEDGLQNNYVIAYESSTSLYKPKSIATLLGYTPADNGGVVHTTGNETIAGIKTFSSTTQSTSTGTGAVVIGGGLGVAKNLYVGGDFFLSGNLTIGGTTTTVNAQNLSVSDNMIYLNNGIQTTITNAVGNGSTVVYTTQEAHNYVIGMVVTISGITPSAYNLSNQTITAVTTNSFTVANSATGTYSSGGTARAKSAVNPDLGFAGGYNDGSYAHAGLFRDATDNVWKFFKGYTPEPDASPYIDTAHASFAYADLRVAAMTATSFVKVGGTSAQFLKADGSVDTNTYLTSFTETDPTVPAHVKSITTTEKSNWNTAYSWGNHAVQGYATTTYVDTQVGTRLPLAGGTMTGNINWAQTDRGLTWGMNTDGAYIKFFNTGDGDPDSRLEYATSDNGDEYHRWVISGVERMNLKTVGLSVNGIIYSTGYGDSTQWNTAYSWGNHAGLYASTTHTHTFASLTSKPTTLSGYGITDAQPLDGDLTSIAGLTGTTGLLKKTAANTWVLDTTSYLTSYTETDTLATVTGRGATTSTAVTFSGGATISNLLLNGAPSYTEGSLALGAMSASEGGQLVLNKATSYTYAAHLDIWQDVFRILYGTNTSSAGVALSVNLSTRQLILPQYTSASTFTGTAAGVLAFDSSGNIITMAVPGGAVSSVSGGTGVSVNSTTGAVVVSIGQSVATSASPTFDQIITTNNGNGTNVKIGDDVWLGDVNAVNTLGIKGQQDATAGYITFGSELSNKLGRVGTGDLTWGGNRIWTAGNLTNLNQLTNGPGYLTAITSSQVTTALGYTPYNSTNPSGYITSSALSGYATQTWVNSQGFVTGGPYLPLTGGTLSGNLYTNSEISFRDGAGTFSNTIRSAAYPSEGYPSGSNYWLEYRAKGGHHFVLNVDGGVGAPPNNMDDFIVWQGDIDGDRLLELSNAGNLTIRGMLTEQSSLRYKENIVSLESVTDKISKLRPVRYNKIGSSVNEIGLIAEEVAELFPEFVNYNAKGDVESLNYTRLSVVLLQTVKELSDKINKLETK